MNHTLGDWHVVPKSGPGGIVCEVCWSPDGEVVAEGVYTLADGNLIAAAPDLLEALKAITSNNHIDLGDLIYKVKDAEGEGWDGESVTQWSDAVSKVKAAITKAEGKEGA